MANDLSPPSFSVGASTRSDGDPRPLLGRLTPEQLAERLKGPGRSRQVFRARAEGLDPFSVGVLADGLRTRLHRSTRPNAARVVHRSVARDQTTKLLVDLGDAAVETVVIPDEGSDRATLCVSSQVGCARGCAFCVTATMGLGRNLAPDEIVSQVDIGLREARERQWHLRNVVFMGMGEPLDNAASVRSALDILTDHRGYGIAPKHVTVSTVAPRVPAVQALRGWPARLAWSLHAARPEIRDRLVPKPHPEPADLAAAFAEVCRLDRRPLFVEMTLMDEVNDGPDDMQAAADLLGSFPTEVRFNLIAMNPGRSDLRPSPRVEACQAQLQAAGFFCSVRRPRGQDADAACGQLAVRSSATLVSLARRE